VHCPRGSSGVGPSVCRCGGGRDHQEDLLRFQGPGGRQIRLSGRQLKEKLCAWQPGALPGLPSRVCRFGTCLFTRAAPCLPAGNPFPECLPRGVALLLRLSRAVPALHLTVEPAPCRAAKGLLSALTDSELGRKRVVWPFLGEKRILWLKPALPAGNLPSNR